MESHIDFNRSRFDIGIEVYEVLIHAHFSSSPSLLISLHIQTANLRNEEELKGKNHTHTHTYHLCK